MSKATVGWLHERNYLAIVPFAVLDPAKNEEERDEIP